MLPSISVTPLPPPFSGTNIDDMEISNFMEQLLDKDVEVLYFTNPVKDVNNFASISKEGIVSMNKGKYLFNRSDSSTSKNNKYLTKCIKNIYGINLAKVSIPK